MPEKTPSVAPRLSSASVRVMRSHDYNHFEITLSSETAEPLTLDQVEDLRREAARLVDRAVEDYQTADEDRDRLQLARAEYSRLGSQVDRIKEKPLTEWTADERAAVSHYQDRTYWDRRLAPWDYRGQYQFTLGEE